ncbi:hypothetical protein D3C72_1610030 [compost metagenome]
MPCRQYRQKHHFDGQARRAQHAPKIGHQAFFANERRKAVALAVAQEAQRHGLDFHGRRTRRFEQAGVERKQVEAFGRRTFREQPHRVAQLEAGLHGLAHGVHRVALAAFNEERARPRHQPADHGPFTDLALGHEGRGARGIQDEDIDPGDVVGHQQYRTAHARVALEGHLHTTGRHQRARPRAVQPGPASRADEGVDQTHAKQAKHDQRQHQGQP